MCLLMHKRALPYHYGKARVRPPHSIVFLNLPHTTPHFNLPPHHTLAHLNQLKTGINLVLFPGLMNESTCVKVSCLQLNFPKKLAWVKLREIVLGELYKFTQNSNRSNSTRLQ